jgi:hypothetical protein
MPNIPPLVSYFSTPFANASQAVIAPPDDALYVELAGLSSAGGSNVASLTSTAGFQLSGSTGNIQMSNIGVNSLAGAGGIACVTDASQQCIISFPADNDSPSFILPITPTVFGDSNVVEIPPNSARQMFSILLPKPANYCRMSLQFTTGTSNNAVPFIYTTNPAPSTNDTFFFLSPTTISGLPLTPPIFLDNTPNTFWYPQIDVEDFETTPPSGGTAVPTLMTLQMNSPTPTSQWYVGLGQTGSDTASFFWDRRVISLFAYVARGEECVYVPFDD